MKKILLILLLSYSSYAGTEYGPASTGLDSTYSYASGGLDEGFSRANYKVAMDASCRVYILQQFSVGAGGFRGVVTTNWGTSWSTYLNLFTQSWSGTHLHSTINAFGDSAFAYYAGEASTPSKVRKFVAGDTSSLSLDTISTNSTSGGSRGSVMPFGSTAIVLHTDEGTTDSTYLYQTDGAISQSVSYIRRDGGPKYGGGPRVPFPWATDLKGGFAFLDVANEDLFWADTAGGFDTLSTALVPNDIPGIGNAGELDISLIQVKDSYALTFWQTGLVAATCSLVTRPFVVSGVGGGSGAVSYSAAATGLLTPGHIPGGARACPTLSVLWGTDSVFAFYRYWADTTNEKDSIDIAYRVSPDKGATWGDQQILRPATKAAKLWALSSAPKIYRSGDDIRGVLVYTDSLTSRDTLRPYLWSVTTTPPSSGGSNTVVRGTPIRGSVVR